MTGFWNAQSGYVIKDEYQTTYNPHTKSGYCLCPDYKFNNLKVGKCKHIWQLYYENEATLKEKAEAGINLLFGEE